MVVQNRSLNSVNHEKFNYKKSRCQTTAILKTVKYLSYHGNHSLIWTKSGKVMHIEISFDTFYTDWHECGRWLPCMEFADKILIFAVCVCLFV